MTRILGTAGTAPKARKVIKRAAVTHAPVTDVQSSGGDYGTRKANTYKRTRVYKRTVAAAAPSRQTDATSSGPGYGTPRATAYTNRVARATASVAAAKANKPFVPAHIKDAIALGLPEAKGMSIGADGSVLRKIKRSLLGIDSAASDYNQPLDPRKGGPLLKTYTKKAGLDAAGLKILSETARPLHAIAGLANAGTHGFTEGLLHNKPYTFGTALKKAGVPSAIAGPAGFVGDVAADPTTYVTFGAGSVARNVATKEAERVALKAAKAGMTKEGQQTVARAAFKKAIAKAPDGQGVSVKMAGHSVPGVTTGTAAAGRVVKKVAAKAPDRVKAVGAGVRNAASDVRPQMVRAGENKAEHVAVRRAGRQARAEARLGTAQAERHARALRNLVPADQYESVISAVERNKLAELPAHLQEPARQVRDSLKHAKVVRRKAGISEGDVTLGKGPGAAVNYFPHNLANEVKPGQGIHETGIAAQTKGVRKVRLASSKKRTDLRPISAQNPGRVAAGDTPFSTNLPLIHGEYMAGTAQGVASRSLAANLARIGRPLKDGMALGEGDTVFHFHNGELTPLKAVPTKHVAGQYVVLDRRTVEREFANVAPQADRTTIGAIFDRGTAGFKRIATMTPGFHARNLVGDTQMAYLTQPGHLLPRNAVQAGRAVRRLGGIERHEGKSLAAVPADTRRIRIARSPKTTIKIAGTPTSIDGFLAGAQKHGVIRSGYVGRELREQGKGVGRTTRVGGKVTAAGHQVNRWMQNREDWMRLATYKHGLDSGLSASEAADLSLGIHIDYGDLTKFERSAARRIVPFYTFSARALPIHVKALVTKPGKFANLEKFREEAALTTGVNLSDEQKKLKLFQARQVPLILKLGGKTTVLSDSLPLNLLNEVPASANPGKYINELSQWMAGMLSPIIKDPVEMYANRSFFFRSDIQNQSRPLVSAPTWVSVIYQHDKGLAKKLGITPNYFDKKSGQKVWGWNGQADYIAKAIPGLPNLLQQLATQGANRRGQSEMQKIIGGLTGVKAEPLDPAGAAIEALYPRLNDVTTKLGALNQQGIKAANATTEYKRLSQEQHDLQATITKLSAQRGDKVPLYSSGRKKATKKGPWGGSQSSGSGWGSSSKATSGWGQ